MSALLYNGNVQTQFREADNNITNLSTEFSFEPNKIYVGPRIANLGLFGEDNVNYNRLVGAYGIISKIEVLDGGLLLDSIDEFPLWSAFKAYNKPNSQNLDLDNILACSDVGNYVQEETNSEGSVVPWNPKATSQTTKSAEADTNKAWLDLNCLNFFAKMKSIDTSVFKNLRVILYYNSDYDQMVEDTGNTGFSTCRPVMIVDEVLSDPKGKLKYEGHSYNALYHDVGNWSAPSPQITTGVATQTNEIRLNGFNNKAVSRMLIMKVPQNSAVYKTNDVNYRTGPLCSVSNANESLQVLLDGEPIFPQRVEGLTKPSQRLRYLNETWGECSCPPFMNSQAYAVASQAEDRGKRVPDGNKVISMMDVYGFRVDKAPITGLDLHFQRTNHFVAKTGAGTVPSATLTANAISNSAQNIHVFGEVPRQIVLDGNGGYNMIEA